MEENEKNETKEITYGSVPEEGREMKHVSDSLTENSHLLFPMDMNTRGNLFGGRLLQWMDELAGIVAQRHSGTDVVTAAIDNLRFKSGATLGDTVFMRGYVTWVGNSSMEVRIDTYAEKRDGMRNLINRAYFVMVAIGENGRPKKTAGLIVETLNEKIEWESGIKRQELRKRREAEGY